MRYSKIHKLDVSNGEGVGVALFVQGCHFHCKNCFNSETWDFNGGKEWDSITEGRFLDLIDKPYITRITLLGGEPLADENINSIENLLFEIRDRFGTSKKIWLYTGYRFEEIYNKKLYFAVYRLTNETQKAKNEITRFSLLEYIDVLVDGQYIDELKNISLKFRGSSNQRIIDVKKSLKENQAVLYIK